MEECGICGEGLDTKYSLKISCGHKYHYRCIFDDFKNSKNFKCPYCSKNCERLPYVNGCTRLPKYQQYIYYSNKPEYQRCNHILTRGKNKGVLCNKHVLLGYEKCKNHL